MIVDFALISFFRGDFLIDIIDFERSNGLLQKTLRHYFGAVLILF